MTPHTCTAAKRFIVVAEVAEAFTECFVEETRKLRTGNPLDETTDVGPLAKSDSLVELTGQYEATVRAGARVAYRAELEEGRGYFFPPTLLASVSPDMVAAQEETFGPLAAILSVRDADAAIQVANHSPYGLGCSIWTCGVQKAHQDACSALEYSFNSPY